MAHSIQKKIKFSKGQVSPQLVERTDLELYNSSAQEIKNMVSTVYGGIRSRSGTNFVDVVTTMDEVSPSSITSTVFSDTTHMTDLTEKTSGTVGDNKIIATLDYGDKLKSNSILEIKNISLQAQSQTITFSTPGSYTQYLQKGTYEVIVVGAGSGGILGQNRWGDNPLYWIINGLWSGGASGAYVKANLSLDAGDYAITVGKGSDGYWGHKEKVGYDQGEWEFDYKTTDGGNSSFIESSTQKSIIAEGGKAVEIHAPDNYTLLDQYQVINGDNASPTSTGFTFNKIESSFGSTGASDKGKYTEGEKYSKTAGGVANYNGYGEGGYALFNWGKYGDNAAGGWYTHETTSGANGFVSIKSLSSSTKIKIMGSTDGTNYVYITDADISEIASTISVQLTTKYRYIQVSIDDDDYLNSFLNLQYIRCVTTIKGVDKVKLDSFVFNNQEKYLLVFMSGMVQIYQNDKLIQILVANGLTDDILDNLKTSYKDDTIILTHPDMHPKKILRTDDGFTWSDFDLENIPYFAFDGETTTTFTTGITPSGTDGSVKITCDSDIFASNWVGQYIDGNGGRLKITQYVSGTVLNGYTVIPFYTTDKISTWDKISGYEPVWSASRGYPNTCLFAQQRLWFGGSRSLPAHIWASRLGDYNNFKNSGNYDNDSIDVTMLTNNKIINLVECRGLHIFTSGEEWTASEEGFTPDQFSVKINTTNGSYEGLKPIVLNGVICYVEKNGRSLLSYIYDYNQASYRSDNLSLLSNLISAPVNISSVVNSSVDKGDFIYLVKDDGTMIVACVSIDQSIFSLSQYVTDGNIVDVCSVVDDVYMAVVRNSLMCIEKIINNSRTDCITNLYLSKQSVTGLSKYNNKKVCVYNDDNNYGFYNVTNDTIVLDKIPNENCNIGIVYDFDLVSNPIDINGKTTTIKKRIAKATLLTTDTERLEFNNQKKANNTKYEYYACTNYSDDVRFTITGEFYPVNILSVTLNLNYEG